MTKLVFHSLDGAERSLAVLELISDTHAWVKDREGRFVFGNRLFYDRFGINSLQGLIGKTDFDLAPSAMALSYRDDDERVLQGLVITDRLELILGPKATVEWFLTSKWPIYTPAGAIIGTIGISRHLNKAETRAVPLHDLSAPIDYISEHLGENFSVETVAKASNLSVSALERRFKKHLHKTPLQYINEMRLEQARNLLLQTGKPIGVIALETGFADHSHFTRSFVRQFGITPRAARDSGARLATGGALGKP